jgi:hypothetical protein
MSRLNKDAADIFNEFLQPFIRGGVVTVTTIDTRKNTAAITLNSSIAYETFKTFLESECTSPSSKILYDAHNHKLTVQAHFSDDLNSLVRDKNLIPQHYDRLHGIYINKINTFLQKPGDKTDDVLSAYLLSQDLGSLIYIDSLLTIENLKPNKKNITLQFQSALAEREAKIILLEETKRQQQQQEQCVISLEAVLSVYLDEFTQSNLLAVIQTRSDRNCITVISQENPLLIKALAALAHNQKIIVGKQDAKNISIRANPENIAILQRLIKEDKANIAQPPIYISYIMATFKQFLHEALRLVAEALKPGIEELLIGCNCTSSSKASGMVGEQYFNVRYYLNQFNTLCETGLMAWAVQTDYRRTLADGLRESLLARASRVKTGLFGGLIYHDDPTAATNSIVMQNTS